MDSNLPVDILHWSLAILPLVLLLVMLVIFRWSGGTSGWIAMALATTIGFFMFQAPLDNLGVGFGKGLWEAFFILLVVWPALMLYQATSDTGAFKVIRRDIQEHSQNQLFLVLGFGFVFASFLQGVAGFGVPIAVVAPLLVGIGVKPVMAIVIPLIGHAWANMFGTLSVGWIATVNTVEIEAQTLTVFYTGILLWIANIIGGLMITWLYGKWKAVKEGFLAVVVISVIHGGGQLGILFFDPVLSTFIATILAFGALFALSRMKRYKEKSAADEKTDVMEEEEEEDDEKETPNISLHQAFMPYYFLTISTVLLLGIPPVTEFLEQFEVGPPFPAVETGYGFEMEAVESYSPIAPLTHPGFFLFLSFAFAYFWYRRLNLYKNNSNPVKKILKGTKDNALGATLAISGFLTMSMIMENSGQTNVLALGIAEVSGPAVYVALANVIGIIGAFMTSSNTSSNVLFAPLHGSVVNSMDNLGLPIVIAAQSAGGAIGNVISPANVILGTSTTGAQGQESEVYKRALLFVAIAGGLVSAVAVIVHFLAG